MTRIPDHAPRRRGCFSDGAALPPLEFVMKSLHPQRPGAFYAREWDEKAVNWVPASHDKPSQEAPR